MRVKVEMNSKGEVKAHRIEIPIQGGGGELGQHAVTGLVSLISGLKEMKTERELEQLLSMVYGWGACCKHCGFLTERVQTTLCTWQRNWQKLKARELRKKQERQAKHEKGLYMQPIQGERRRRAGQKHRLCAAADTAGIRGRLSTHYAAFIYDAVHGR